VRVRIPDPSKISSSLLYPPMMVFQMDELCDLVLASAWATDEGLWKNSSQNL
jgi:hypothetical protein